MFLASARISSIVRNRLVLVVDGADSELEIGSVDVVVLLDVALLNSTSLTAE